LIPASTETAGKSGRAEVTSDAVLIVDNARAAQEQVEALLSMLRLACCQQRGGCCSQCGKPLEPNEPATVRRIRAALEQPVDLDFNEAPLPDVLEYIKHRFGIEVQLDNSALEESGVAQFDMQVTQHLRGVPLKQALKRILGGMELTSVIRDEVLLVTSQSAAQAIPEIRVYCIGSLVGSSGTGGPMPTHMQHELIDSIKAHLAPATWGRRDGLTAEAKAFAACGVLVVRQTAAVHDQIADFLAARCRLRQRQFSACQSGCPAWRATRGRWLAWRKRSRRP
ncbi:MAG TPA: hypothetical protein VIK18_00965, partial [Pirellulales bacterium]